MKPFLMVRQIEVCHQERLPAGVNAERVRIVRITDNVKDRFELQRSQDDILARVSSRRRAL
jgi:hypothetical protein